MRRMSVTHFKCPDGSTYPIKDCLAHCPHKRRCMARPALMALADSIRDRGLTKFSTTELLKGTRELYLSRMYQYAIKPESLIAAFTGTGLHKINEEAVQNESWVTVEQRLEDEITSGQIDAYGYIFSDDELAICDYKTTSGFKVMKALGVMSTDVETEQVYKTGPKRGQHKTVKKLTTDNAHLCLDWLLQQNYYRMLLEEHGMKVDAMYIQAYIKDSPVRLPVGYQHSQFVIKLGKISNHWLKEWFGRRKERIEEAIRNEELPPKCSDKDTWNGTKCERFCDVAHLCRQHEIKESFKNMFDQEEPEKSAS